MPKYLRLVMHLLLFNHNSLQHELSSVVHGSLSKGGIPSASDDYYNIYYVEFFRESRWVMETVYN